MKKKMRSKYCPLPTHWPGRNLKIDALFKKLHPQTHDMGLGDGWIFIHEPLRKQPKCPPGHRQKASSPLCIYKFSSFSPLSIYKFSSFSSCVFISPPIPAKHFCSQDIRQTWFCVGQGAPSQALYKCAVCHVQTFSHLLIPHFASTLFLPLIPWRELLHN